MTVDAILEHLYGEDFDPEYRLIDWTRQAVSNGDIKSFDLQEVNVLSLLNFNVDKQTFSGTFSVAINWIELPSLFSCFLDGTGWLDFTIPGYDCPLGTQEFVPMFIFPDEIQYTIGKLLRRVVPRLKPFGIDRETNAFIDASTSIYDRGGLDVQVQKAFQKAHRPLFMRTDFAPFHKSQSVIIEALWSELDRDRRVCLMPQHWVKLYELLPNRINTFTTRKPERPLILGAWDVSDEAKKRRMREHIQWAIDHGAAETVFDFLKTKTDKWFISPDFDIDRELGF